MKLHSPILYGLTIALIGFFLTRFTVSLAAMETTAQFLFVGIIPLVLGLSLSAYGVILMVGRYEAETVRIVARWCVLGTIAMLVLSLLTILGTHPDRLIHVDTFPEQVHLSMFLIGGAIGGTLTGIYGAQNRVHRRELEQQANRLVLLNRLLRDKVVNAATAIAGHKSVLETDHNPDSVEVIGNQTDRIVEIVDNVKYLVGSEAGGSDRHEVLLEDRLSASIADVRAAYPDATIEYEPAQSLAVLANEQLEEVFWHLLDNACKYAEGVPVVEIHVRERHGAAVVRISDNGSGLPPNQQALLERGQIAEFDDPTTGFGLNIVRLLMESYSGSVDTTVTSEGTTVELTLPRSESHLPDPGRSPEFTAPEVRSRLVGITIASALVAGVTMGVVMQQMAGIVPVIGALYGVADPLVGVITHMFHSVVFGLFFAGILSITPHRYTDGLSRKIGIGVGLAVVLWMVAAGIIMPFWLQLVGIEASLPNLTVPSLIGHLVWGITLATCYQLGDRLLG